MRIYIASSWRNQHAVEMLTEMLETRKHFVSSFVREGLSNDETKRIEEFGLPQWINSKDGYNKFSYDIMGATTSDLVIYIGPSGTDAWAEVGAAHNARIRILGLWAKGEQAGLMRLMVEWHYNYRDLLVAI